MPAWGGRLSWAGTLGYHAVPAMAIRSDVVGRLLRRKERGRVAETARLVREREPMALPQS
jgi:hypothetical protein